MATPTSSTSSALILTSTNDDSTTNNETHKVPPSLLLSVDTPIGNSQRHLGMCRLEKTKNFSSNFFGQGHFETVVYYLQDRHTGQVQGVLNYFANLLPPHLSDAKKTRSTEPNFKNEEGSKVTKPLLTFSQDAGQVPPSLLLSAQTPIPNSNDCSEIRELDDLERLD